MDSPRLALRAVAVVLGLAAPLLAAPPDDRDPVVVTLRPTATALGPQVLVEHIAAVTGGTPELRWQIAKLDLADAPKRGGAIHLSRELLTYRIQLAGIDRGRFRVEGPAQVSVRQASGPPTELDNPVLVKQRDLVKVLARVGKLRVTAMAEAQQDGRKGERIRVRNIDSKKELVGRVIDRGLVEIDF